MVEREGKEQWWDEEELKRGNAETEQEVVGEGRNNEQVQEGRGKEGTCVTSSYTQTWTGLDVCRVDDLAAIILLLQFFLHYIQVFSDYFYVTFEFIFQNSLHWILTITPFSVINGNTQR